MNKSAWQVWLLPTAQKEFDDFPINQKERTLKAIKRLSENPWGFGARKLKGAIGLYRLRIGDYRAIYRIKASEHQVIINRFLHRSKSYRQLSKND